MPIYEYQCLKCDNQYAELVMSGEDEKGVKCPKCGSRRKERMFSSFSTTTSNPDKLASDPGAHREKMMEKAEEPTVGPEYLDQYFR